MRSIVPDRGYTAHHAAIVRAFGGKCRLVRENGEVTLSFHSQHLPQNLVPAEFVQALQSSGIQISQQNGTIHLRSRDIGDIAKHIVSCVVRLENSKPL